MPVKLKDIAEHLNISVSTVSRVLNKKDRVDAETRGRVLKALEFFQYSPNENARNLKNKTAKTIGILITDITNFFFSQVIKGVEEVARPNGYSIIFCNSNGDKEKEEEYIRFLLQMQISGLVIATVGGDSDYYKQYRKNGIPIVFIDNLPQIEDNYDFVAIDNNKAAYDLACHLINLGHKNNSIISGPLNESTANDRLQGWRKALEQNNLPVRKEWIGIGGFSKETGYKIMHGFLNQNEKPTSVFAANNFLAYGAIQAINDKGLKVPEDIALVCFDAVDPTGLVKPQITSIIQPSEEIGRIAGGLIVKKAMNSGLKIFERVILEPQLDIKDSCGYKRVKERFG